MKNLFPGHYARATSFKDALPKAIVIFDTNVLLNFYEFGPITRERTFKTLAKIQQQCWLPYHVALEFHRNRFGRIEKAFQGHQSSIVKLNQGVDELTQNVEKQDVLKHDPKTAKLIQTFKKAGEALAKHAEKAADQLPKRSSEDPVNESLAVIFEGRVGTPPSQEQIDEIDKEGRRRIEHKHPPSLTDSRKSGEKFLDRGVSYAGEYGDLYIWKQILAHIPGVEEKCYLIFVTDERKQDWWAKEGSNSILGPSPALSQELALTAPGWNLRMYSSAWFFEQLSEAVGGKLSDEDLEEIRDAATSYGVDTLNAKALFRRLDRLKSARGTSRTLRMRAYENWLTRVAKLKEKGASVTLTVEKNHYFFWERTKNDEYSHLNVVTIVEPSNDPLSDRIDSLVHEALRMGSALGLPSTVVFDVSELPQDEKNEMMTYFIFDFSLENWPAIKTIYTAELKANEIDATQVA